jgi:hypothetical protein
MTNAHQSAYWPTNGWRRSTPQEQDIDPVMLARAAHEARHNLPTLYSLLVIRNGHIVFSVLDYKFVLPSVKLAG